MCKKIDYETIPYFLWVNQRNKRTRDVGKTRGKLVNHEPDAEPTGLKFFRVDVLQELHIMKVVMMSP